MIVDESQAHRALSGRLPSERARAAEWFLSNAQEAHALELARAIANEPVPSVKRMLSAAASRTRKRTTTNRDLQLEAVLPEQPTQILDDLSAIIRHETEPVIGWLRRSAAQELGVAYESSGTFRNIELLRRRLRGLEALTAAHRMPSWSRASLTQLILECSPPIVPPVISREGSAVVDDFIDTDTGLMSIILSNALLNANEAASDLETEKVAHVWVENGVSDREFWVSVSNRFRGDGFDLHHVAHTGASTKANHKGLGLRAMKLASERLGYELSLTAAGGTAFFSLRGKRYRG